MFNKLTKFIVRLINNSETFYQRGFYEMESISINGRRDIIRDYQELL